MATVKYAMVAPQNAGGIILSAKKLPMGIVDDRGSLFYQQQLQSPKRAIVTPACRTPAENELFIKTASGYSQVASVNAFVNKPHSVYDIELIEVLGLLESVEQADHLYEDYTFVVNNNANNGYFTGWNEYFSGGWRGTVMACGKYSDNPEGIYAAFTGVAIDKGKTIADAKVKVRAAGTKTPAAVCIASFAYADSYGAPGSSSNGFNCVKTQDTVLVSNATQTDGEWFVINGLGPALQSIVNREGWVSGNSICFFMIDSVSSNSNTYDFYTLGNGADYAPQLVVTM